MSSASSGGVAVCRQEAVEWVSSASSGDLQHCYRDFMSRHGHRCVREAELREKSWQSEPAKLIQALQVGTAE